jgi:hypothetical protein
MTWKRILALIACCIPFASLVVEAQEAKAKRLFVVIVNDKRGYIDRSGNIVIEPQFDGAGDFSEGLAVVATRKNGYAEGYIDETGKIVIEPRFDKAGEFSEGLAPVGFDQDKREVTLGSNTYVTSSSHPSYKWGYIDRTGKYIAEPKYSIALGFSEGLAVVKESEGKYGFIDRTGKTAIPQQYEFADSFSEGLACVMINGKYGFIDKSGNVAIRAQFSSPGYFREGLAAVRVGGKMLDHKQYRIIGSLGGRYVYIDKTGTPVIKLSGDVGSAAHFSEGLASVGVIGKHDYTCKGYIDKTGKFVIEPRFSTAEDFSEGLALIILNPDFGFPYEGFGFIDRTGRIVLTFKYPSDYTMVNNFAGSLAWVETGGNSMDFRNAQYGYIDKSGIVIWTPSK